MQRVNYMSFKGWIKKMSSCMNTEQEIDHEVRILFEKACKEDDVDVFVNLVKTYDIDVQKQLENYGTTLCHYAASNNSLKIMTCLVKDYKIDVDLKDFHKISVLSASITNEAGQEVAFYLIKNHANVNSKAANLYTPLHVASIYNYVKLAQELISLGADVNAQDSELSTPLHEACWTNSLEVSVLLLENGANINACDKYKRTPLHRVCRWDKDELINKLVEFNADVNAQDQSKLTPLHLTASFYSSVGVSALLKHKANAQIQNDFGSLALHNAATNNMVRAIEELIENGANINLQNSYQQTPLTEAAFSNSKDTIKVLLEHGANVYVKYSDEQTALHIAASHCEKIAVKYLLDHSVDLLHLEDANGNTALHEAVKNYREDDTLAYLLQSGGHVNAQNKDKETPLHKAVQKNYKNQVIDLLNFKADVNLANIHGSTALHEAVKLDVKALISFRQYRGDEELRKKLTDEACRSNRDIIVSLLSHGGDVNLKDENSQTPQFYAKDHVKDLFQNVN